MNKIILPFTKTLLKRLEEDSPLIQVVLGPRQVGKTTAAIEITKKIKQASYYVSADEGFSASTSWLIEHWQEAKRKDSRTVLFIDEIQKIPNWSEVIKSLWDKEKKSKRLKVVLLGSSALSLQSGLTESLAGRYEKIRAYHWNFEETRKAFGWDLDNYLKYGGYPGSYEYINDYSRWFSYIKDSIIENVIGRDIFQLRTINKPALFRQAFEVLSSYPAQEISYNKILGQLQDKGNTDLVKRYIEIYCGAFLFQALSKYGSQLFKNKTSSPKVCALAPSLSSIYYGDKIDSNDVKGRIFEQAVAADLYRLPGQLSYWRERNSEVDLVYKFQQKLYAIEVKSERARSISGLEKFLEKYPNAKAVIINKKNYGQFSKAQDFKY